MKFTFLVDLKVDIGLRRDRVPVKLSSPLRGSGAPIGELNGDMGKAEKKFYGQAPPLFDGRIPSEADIERIGRARASSKVKK